VLFSCGDAGVVLLSTEWTLQVGSYLWGLGDLQGVFVLIY
jgi:hypothetical protein